MAETAFKAPVYIKPSTKLKKDWFYFWLLDNWKITSGEFAGSPYRFLPNYPFMEAVAKDMSPEIVTMKAAQVGFTELMVAKWYAYAALLQGNLMYVLPTDELAKTLARGRIKEAHSINPYLEQHLSGFDTLQQFKFRSNYMYIRGSQTQIRDGRQYQRQLISIDISRLFGDEVDEWNHRVFGKLQSRLGASLDPIAMYFSTPRILDGGVHKLFVESDQKEWAIRCRLGSCRQWNIGLDIKKHVTYFDEPDRKPHIIICEKCHEPLDRLEMDPQFSGWVAEHPDRERSGYHFNKLFFRAANIDTIVDRFNDPETVEECWNDDLGLPYQPKAFSINNDTLEKCACQSFKTWEEILKECRPLTMGVDIGKTIQYHVRGDRLGMPVMLECGSVHGYDQLSEIAQRLNINRGIVDAQPDFRASLEFVQDMKRYGLSFKVAYFDTHGEKDRVLLRVDTKNTDVVVIARSLAMSQVMFEVVTGKVILPWDVINVDNGDFARHMRAPLRTFKENTETGQQVMYFPRTRKPDHHFMAYVYALCAEQLVQDVANIGRRRTGI